MTSERYVNMFQDFFIPRLQGLPVNKTTYFQQDGATSHTAKISMNILRPLFPGHLIFRYGDIAWPGRSPDLSVCDIYLWGYLKSVVYCAPSHPHNSVTKAADTGRDFKNPGRRVT